MLLLTLSERAYSAWIRPVLFLVVSGVVTLFVDSAGRDVSEGLEVIVVVHQAVVGGERFAGYSLQFILIHSVTDSCSWEQIHDLPSVVA